MGIGEVFCYFGLLFFIFQITITKLLNVFCFPWSSSSKVRKSVKKIIPSFFLRLWDSKFKTFFSCSLTQFVVRNSDFFGLCLHKYFVALFSVSLSSFYNDQVWIQFVWWMENFDLSWHTFDIRGIVIVLCWREQIFGFEMFPCTLDKGINTKWKKGKLSSTSIISIIMNIQTTF